MKNEQRNTPSEGATSRGRELIVIVQPGAALRAIRAGVPAMEGVDVSPLARVLAWKNATLTPLFGLGEARPMPETARPLGATGREEPDLSIYYRVEAADQDLDELAERLREIAFVEAAYVTPPAELGEVPRPEGSRLLHALEPRPQAALAATPDFTARQGYLDAAPGGIDARYAWLQPGGTGPGVRIIDVEKAWNFLHEDLQQNEGGVLAGTPSLFLNHRNHGTNVLGVMCADNNGFGVTGICYNAYDRGIVLSSANAIVTAADNLGPGDIILIPWMFAGPRYNYDEFRPDQRGFIAVEWYPQFFDAIRYATGKGIIVVEIGGNGAENLDDPLYNTPKPGFPAWWTNPFNRANRDSGAIVVGAGAPPPGTHGRDWGPDRSRLEFTDDWGSNYGSIFDAQGWGCEVTTCGGIRYNPGDLQGGPNENVWYTDIFSGTSSASAMVAGALACVQGVLRARGLRPLSPAQARGLLRATGSPQQDAPGRPATQRIGNRPDLRQLLQHLLRVTVTFKSLRIVDKLPQPRPYRYAFEFAVDRQSRRWEQAIPLDQPFAVPADVGTFRADILNDLSLGVSTQLRPEKRWNHHTQEWELRERPVGVEHQYPRWQRFFPGVHTERSDEDRGYFEITYRLDLEEIP